VTESRQAIGKPACRRAGALFFDPVNVERALLRIVVWPLHHLAVRLSGGRIGATSARDDGVGTLILTTTGRRSGALRSTPLDYMPDSERFVVVASNAGRPMPVVILEPPGAADGE
jgi:hypothetical protein